MEGTAAADPNLRGETLAALGAPIGQDRPTRAGAHPSPETVLACASPVIGLESALHVRAPGKALVPRNSEAGRPSVRRSKKDGQTGVLHATEFDLLPCVERRPSLGWRFRIHTCG